VPITSALDGWIATVFDDQHAESTWQAIADAQHPDAAAASQREAAERKVADCKDRLAKYRAALDAGADPLVVTGWMREVQGEQLAAERELGRATDNSNDLTIDQVRALVAGVRDAVAMLATADPKLKAQVYAELGIEVTYQPNDGRALASARVGQCVSEGGLEPPRPCGH